MPSRSAAATTARPSPGLNANTPWYNLALGFVILIGRYPPIIFMMAVAGSVAAKPTLAATAGTLRTDTLNSAASGSATILVVGALTFFPALVLGPIAEFFAMKEPCCSDHAMRKSRRIAAGPLRTIAFAARRERKSRGRCATRLELLRQALIRFAQEIRSARPDPQSGDVRRLARRDRHRRLTFDPTLFGPSNATSTYNGVVTLILLSHRWFANLAEALAEGRGKAKAAALRQTKTELSAKRSCAPEGRFEDVSGDGIAQGRFGPRRAGRPHPHRRRGDRGHGFCRRSAITGESAPVLKEAGTDMFSSVTAGTLMISDWLLVRVTADPGESFLDRMIHLVEGAKRQKTPNEIALTVLLSILTLIFVIVVAAMAPVASYLNAQINVADLIALLVALIPTTIGALLSAIGIAGIDRTVRFNVLAMSGKAVEAAGDVHTLMLDKTGTITMGNRQATDFIPLAGCPRSDLSEAAYLASLFDTTPEGRTIVALPSSRRSGRRRWMRAAAWISPQKPA